MGLITSVDHAKKLERDEAIAGIVQSIFGLDDPREIADALKVAHGVMTAVVRAKGGRLVIYDRKANRFVTRDPAEGGFETRKDADEQRRCQAIAATVWNFLAIKTPEQLEDLLLILQRAARDGTPIQLTLNRGGGPTTAEVVES